MTTIQVFNDAPRMFTTSLVSIYMRGKAGWKVTEVFAGKLVATHDFGHELRLVALVSDSCSIACR